MKETTQTYKKRWIQIWKDRNYPFLDLKRHSIVKNDKYKVWTFLINNAHNHFNKCYIKF